MHDSRIVAVDHVHLDVPPGLAEALTWFYGDLGGLELLSGDAGPFRLRFKSGRLELRLREVSEPEIDGVEVRVTLLVDSLAQTRELLDEGRWTYERISPIAMTDRRIQLLDPAGHRVELKQYWPYGPL